MEWDQYIYKKISAMVRYLRREKVRVETLAARVPFGEIQGRLLTLGRLLTGRAVTVRSVEGVGGCKGLDFLLPEQYDHSDEAADNVDFYLFRVFFMYGQMALRQYHIGTEPLPSVQALTKAQQGAEAVVEFLCARFPAFGLLHQKIQAQELRYQQQRRANDAGQAAAEWLYGRYQLVSPDQAQKIEALLVPVDRNTVAFDKDKEDYTEIKSPNKEHTEVLKVDTRQQEAYTLTHNFEKIETLDAFTGRWRDFDGSDDLEEHAEALRELDLRYLVRVDNPVHSIYQSDFVRSLGLIEASSAAEGEEARYSLSYPEWDEQRQAYKGGYCKVFPHFATRTDSRYTQAVLVRQARLIREMQGHAERFLTEYYVKKRLEWGEEPDVEAMVEAFVDRRCGLTPSERLYESRRKRPKSVAVLILTDTSLSTDGYIRNRRVLDTEKEALIMAGEVWSRLGLRYQIDTFSSRTHQHCSYQTIKGFHQDWATTQSLVGGIESSGYTRIGAALRHATYLLSQVRADSRWLLVLTDGKPNDYDQYEGRYGIADTHKAIIAARQQQIQVSAIAIDEKAKFYLPQMFGVGGFEILTDAKKLPFALLQGYLKLLR